MNNVDSDVKPPELDRRASSLKIVTLTELRRHFGRIFREVEQGQRFVITRRGRPIADLVPAGQPPQAPGGKDCMQ